MEEVRISWFRELAVAGANIEGQGPVIVNASMEFLIGLTQKVAPERGNNLLLRGVNPKRWGVS
jgi:hypothetical protein